MPGLVTSPERQGHRNGNAKGPICYINGKKYPLPPGRGEATLLQYLRGAYLP